MKTKEELIRIYSAYLPYGLKGRCIYDEDDEFNEDYTLAMNCDKNNIVGIYSWINGTYPMKPYLYPLEFLTKEIEHEGKRFVPIINLMKMLNINGEMFEIEDGVMGYGWDEKYGDDAQGYAVGWDFDLKCFVVGYSDDINYETGIDFEYDHNSKSKHLYELPFHYNTFQKLLEWHFNVFSLAEGEFINKATLKEN